MTIEQTSEDFETEVVIEEPTNVIATIVENETQIDSYQPAKVLGGIPHLNEYMELADAISRTAMVPSSLRNKPAEVLAVVMYGAELGIGPMQSLQQVNFIEGKPSMAPELMRALIRKAGHKLNISQSKTACVIVGERGDTGEIGETEFTIEDAVDAELCSIDANGKVRARSSSGKALPWEKYTRDMLLARATSRIARMMFSDVVAGMSYTPEEVESFTERSDDDKPKRSRSRSTTSNTTRRAAPEVDGVEIMASDETIKLITDGIKMLKDDERAIVVNEWKKLNLPPIAHGLTVVQGAQAWSLVSRIMEQNDAQNSHDAGDSNWVADAQSSTSGHESTLDAQNDAQSASQGIPDVPAKRNASEIEPPKATKSQYGKIRGLCRDVHGYDTTEDCERKCSSILGYGITLDKVTKAEAGKIIDQLLEEQATPVRHTSVDASKFSDEEERF